MKVFLSRLGLFIVLFLLLITNKSFCQVHYNLNKYNGLPTNEAFDLVFLSDGQLLVSTNEGVVLFHNSNNYSLVSDTINKSSEIYKLFQVDSKIIGVSKENIVEINLDKLQTEHSIYQTAYEEVLDKRSNFIVNRITATKDSIYLWNFHGQVYSNSIHKRTGKCFLKLLSDKSRFHEIEKNNSTGDYFVKINQSELAQGIDVFGDSILVKKAENSIFYIPESVNSGFLVYSTYVFYLRSGLAVEKIQFQDQILSGELKDGKLFLGTLNGLIRYSVKTKNKIKYLEGNVVGSIKKDNYSGIWCTTLSNGVYRINEFVSKKVDVKGGNYLMNSNNFVYTSTNDLKIYQFDRDLVHSTTYNTKLRVKFFSCFENMDIIKHLDRRDVFGAYYKLNFPSSSFDISSTGIKSLTLEDKSSSKVILDQLKSSRFQWDVHIEKDSIRVLLPEKILVIDTKSSKHKMIQLDENYNVFDYCNGRYVLGAGNSILIQTQASLEKLSLPRNESLLKLKMDESGLWAVTKSTIFYYALIDGTFSLKKSSNRYMDVDIKDFSQSRDDIYVLTENSLFKLNKDEFIKDKGLDQNFLSFKLLPSEYRDSKILKLNSNYFGYGLERIKYAVSFGKGKEVVTNENVVELNKLPSGNNTLRVSLIDKSAVELVGQKSTFFVPEKFWNTWLGIFLIVILIAGVLLLTIFLTSAYIVKIKNRQIKAAELESRVLRSQMNPHFTFNSLNTAIYLIIKKDNDGAVQYLSKFSKLLRGYLNSSNRDLISLDEDLKRLKIFLEIESIRFENDFVFKINIQNDLELDDIFIPAMLLQPIVENSIWHGLRNKEGLRILFVNVTKRNGFLFFEVLDNGIGLDIKEKSDDSFGINNTIKRIQHFNRNFRSTDFTIGPRGERKSGVRVQIKLKIDNKG